MPKLTICIPTHNRQYWCKKTVEGIIKSLKGDVELLIVDGSDNGECLISFVEQLNDDRVRLVPPTGEFLPMMDNWNRAIKECKGEWISFIGDDDFIAPDIIDFIEMVEKKYQNVDALGWNRIPYDWPENRNNYKATPIPATYDLYPVNNKILQENYCRFVQNGQVPFGIYHAAVKRTLVDKMRNRFGPKDFEYPVVDFEFTCKILFEASTMVFSQRPLSVAGASKKSNSSGTTSLERKNYILKKFEDEHDVALNAPDFPFPSSISFKSTVANTLRWFLTNHDVEVNTEGWEENFVLACARETHQSVSREWFDDLCNQYKPILETWHGGKYAHLFDPVYTEVTQMKLDLVGCYNDMLHVDKFIANCQTPAEFYEVVQNFMVPVEKIGIKFKDAA